MDELARILADRRVREISLGDRLDRVTETLGAPDGVSDGLAVIWSYGPLQVTSWDGWTVDLLSLETPAIERPAVRQLLETNTDKYTEDQFGFRIDQQHQHFISRCELAVGQDDELAKIVLSKRPWGAVDEDGSLRSVIDMAFDPPISVATLGDLLALSPALDGNAISVTHTLNEAAASTGIVLYSHRKLVKNAMLISRADVDVFDPAAVVAFIAVNTSCRVDWT